MNKLEIKNLHASIEGKEIIKGVSLIIEEGEIVVLMGPNGSGKSTLANSLMGNPKYKIEKGKILLNNKDITQLSADKRAKKGLFLSFQYPSEISGVTISNFLRTALNSTSKKKISVIDFQKLLEEKIKIIKINPKLAKRYLNEGFSGGEKKKSEILQLSILNPKFAILDETDSGLDVDSLKIVAESINKIKQTNKTGILLITHYNRILKYIKPNKVLIFKEGKIIKEGGPSLANKIDIEGYEKTK